MDIRITTHERELSHREVAYRWALVLFLIFGGIWLYGPEPIRSVIFGQLSELLRAAITLALIAAGIYGLIFLWNSISDRRLARRILETPLTLPEPTEQRTEKLHYDTTILPTLHYNERKR